MKNEIVNSVINLLADLLSPDVLSKLTYQLASILDNYTIERSSTELSTYVDRRFDLVRRFLVAKKVEGLATSSLRYYGERLKLFCDLSLKPIDQMDTNDIRVFLARFGIQRKITARSIDNLRRILSTFYGWLYSEEIIKSNPLARIKQIKFARKMKTALSAEELERIRGELTDLRDRAAFEFLFSTGARISEVCALDRDSIDWDANQVIVFGKGSKERICYINARARVHLQAYLASRKDDNPALFVSRNRPHTRVKISAFEIVFRDLGRKMGIVLHPHRLRRTAATVALKSGMPFEQVQLMLGHSSPSTTMLYTTIDQDQLKINHSKFLQ